MVVRYKKTYSVTENEDGADYADIIRNIGIKRVVDILAKLEMVIKDDKINDWKLDEIKEMVIDKGKEIWRLGDHNKTLSNIIKRQFEVHEQQLEEIQRYKRKKRFIFF